MEHAARDKKQDPPTSRIGAQTDLFRTLVEGVTDYAIFVLSPDGIVGSWNAGAERIKGYSAEDIVGQHFSRFYPPDAVARGWPQDELKQARKAGRFEDEGWRVRKDGTRFWANVIITALRSPEGTLLGFSKITRDLSERRAQEEALRQSEENFRLLIEGVKDHAIFLLDPGAASSAGTRAPSASRGSPRPKRLAATSPCSTPGRTFSAASRSSTSTWRAASGSRRKPAGV